MTEVARILNELDGGDPHASAILLELLYDELRKLAAAKLAREVPGQTLQATALVHEAYIRLVDSDGSRQWAGRAHFFSAAAEAMRRILVENARKKRRIRHGGGHRRIDLNESMLANAQQSTDLLALDEALARLSVEEPIVAEVVNLRYFGGLTIDQVAAALGISVRTTNRHWAYGRAWLFNEIGPLES